MVFLLHITSTGKHFQDLLTSAIRWRARGKRSFPPASISRDLCELHNTDYLHGARWTPGIQANYKTLAHIDKEEEKEEKGPRLGARGGFDK